MEDEDGAFPVEKKEQNKKGAWVEGVKRGKTSFQFIFHVIFHYHRFIICFSRYNFTTFLATTAWRISSCLYLKTPVHDNFQRPYVKKIM